jgi:hypothetical protein
MIGIQSPRAGGCEGPNYLRVRPTVWIHHPTRAPHAGISSIRDGAYPDRGATADDSGNDAELILEGFVTFGI